MFLKFMGKRHLRKRGVAVVIRQGRVLLVKDKGKSKFSLPGGGVHEKERSFQAAARELHEETGLKARKVTYIGSFNGAVSYHKAFLVVAEGDVHLKSHHEKGGGELTSYIWWDMQSPLPVYQHVKSILGMIKVK